MVSEAQVSQVLREIGKVVAPLELLQPAVIVLSPP